MLCRLNSQFGIVRVGPDEINLAIGKRLAQRRAELGLTLAQVSQRCKVSLQQIHK